MSLQLAAKHLATKGRGPDTELVHMSMDELKSLQDLAKAHGGSLSINPDTGLAEAGFLSSILPMVAGAALTATGIGAPMAALLVGGGMTAATGSLNKGLMAGLGAFGGAGLAGGLMSAGATGTAAEMAGGLSGASAGELAAAQQAAASGAGQGFGANISQMGQGVSALGSEAGRAGFMKGVGGGTGLFKYGAAGLAPMLMGGEDKGAAPAIKPTPPVTPMQFNANPVTPTPAPDVPGYGNLGQDFGRQQRYFNPAFTPVTPPAPVTPVATTTPMSDPYMYAGGMAMGGPVEDMSAANVYDMQNARGGVSDMGIDNSTGMQRMADGGETDPTKYKYERGAGGLDSMADRTSPSVTADPATTIAIGQALQGYGQLAFAPGAAIASMLGHGMTSSGINALGAMESQAATDASNAAAAAQANAGLGSAVDASGEAMGMARGGITGTGELNLNIPLEFGGDAINGFGQGPTNAGFNVNQGPLDLGRGNSQGFGQVNANGYRAVGSGAASSPPGFLTPNPSNTVGLNENPNILGTQLASRLGAVNQNPFAAQPTPEMIAAQGQANLFNPAGTLADLQRRVGDREQPFDEFKQARSRTALRHPGDRMPTDAEFQNMYQNYLQDRNNNLAKIGGMQQTLSSQAQQKEMFDRVNAMQQRLSQMAVGGLAALAGGGTSHLGDYSDGGRLLRGPGDGVSDSIPAMIGNKQPARLADGEFVVPARIVSELGNGSTEAGARKLYAMMDRVQRARRKTVGKGRVAKNTRADKYLPA